MDNFYAKLVSVVFLMSLSCVTFALSTDLKFGDKGDDVLKLQTILNKFGYSVPETGNFLSITKNAVLNYQKDNYIPRTGYVGPITRASLFSKKCSGCDAGLDDSNVYFGNNTFTDTANIKNKILNDKVVSKENSGVSSSGLNKQEYSINVDNDDTNTIYQESWVSKHAYSGTSSRPVVHTLEVVGTNYKIIGERLTYAKSVFLIGDLPEIILNKKEINVINDRELSFSLNDEEQELGKFTNLWVISESDIRSPKYFIKK